MEAVRITQSSTDPVTSLDPADRTAMWELFERHYDGVDREQFQADLESKQHVIRMFDQNGQIRGFSTIQLMYDDRDGERTVTLFSGDTVVDSSCWGQKRLQSEFTRFLVRTKLTHPRHRVFWFLISKGFKTYLLMRNNFTCFPNHERETPSDVKAVLDRVASIKYPDDYDPKRGVIEFEECHGKVKTRYAHVTMSDMANPDIRFFTRANPGYAKGDELCCLAELRFSEIAGALFKYAVKKPLERIGRRAAALAARLRPAPTTIDAIPQPLLESQIS